MENASCPHIAVLPTPGMGHLIPLVEFAKRLVAHHAFSVTFITFAKSACKAQKAFLDTLPASISSLELPPVDLGDIPADSAIETRLSVSSARSRPALRSILRDLKRTTRLVAFIADLFCADTFDAARDVGVAAYMFFPSNLQVLSLLLHLPELDASTTCEYRDLPSPLQLPGCVPIPGADLLHPLQDRSRDCYPWMVHHGRRYRDADVILVNTFDGIEPEAAKILKQPEIGRPPVYLIGPLIQTGQPKVDGSECLKWLDGQPRGSVLFVCFGSGGALSWEQMTELACGLEMSGQRFLWVVRAPTESEFREKYFDETSAKNPLNYLPKGFVERTKRVGMVVPSWAPQLQVLAHQATGGFLSHCGWNSTIESVAHAVPMIAWPLYAEQRMNAVMLTEGTKVAVRPAVRADGVYGREEIASVVKELMEGEEGKKVRARVREVQEAGARALTDDGDSYKALTEVVNKWRSAAAAM